MRGGATVWEVWPRRLSCVFPHQGEKRRLWHKRTDVEWTDRFIFGRTPCRTLYGIPLSESGNTVVANEDGLTWNLKCSQACSSTRTCEATFYVKVSRHISRIIQQKVHCNLNSPKGSVLIQWPLIWLCHNTISRCSAMISQVIAELPGCQTPFCMELGLEPHSPAVCRICWLQ